MQYKVSIHIGERTITKEASADLAVNILAQMVLEENLEVIKRIPLEDLPPPVAVDDKVPYEPAHKYKKRIAKEAKQFSVKPGKTIKVTPAKAYKAKTSSKDEIRATIHALADKGFKPAQIADETGYKLANVYYYMKDYGKKGTKPAVAETPTKIGERAIDQKPAMLTPEQFNEAKDAYEDQMAPDMIGFTLGVDKDEVRKAVKCENYTEYTAKY